MPRHDARVSTRPLTPKQQRFVEEYLVDLNATQAAIRAGYSARNADKLGPRLVGQSRVAEALAIALAAQRTTTEMREEEVAAEIRVLSRSDVRHFCVDDSGTLTLAPGAPDDAWRAVSSVKHKIRSFTDKAGNTTTERSIEYRLWDKNAALEKAAKRLRYYPPERVELTGKDGGPLEVAGVDVAHASPEELAAAASALAAALLPTR